MSRIISYAWTTPALLMGFKSCTRRDWDPKYAGTFKQEQLVHAYNRSPRAKGDHIATVRLLATPALEPLSEMPDEDYDNEGFRWMFAHPEAMAKRIESLPRDHFIREVCSLEGFKRWRQSGASMCVVRFELLELTPIGQQQRARIMSMLTVQKELCDSLTQETL